ncbi:hypothetical protein C0991_003050 [Blastosporella zonata]|nr:hypothetical protein C0991_003050 [Blastosporella zonata]
MSTFHDDLELDEALDELDPLRHLMQQDDDNDEPKSLIPKQLPSVRDETLHLSFSASPQLPIEIALAVDASPGCGGIAWPAGEILSCYLTKRGPEFLHGRTILELGSGTGLVGLVAAKLQLRQPSATHSTPNVWITDQAPLLDIMRRNVHLNDLDNAVAVAELNWGIPLPPSLPIPDLILAADCVYFEPAFPLLVETLCDLVDAGVGEKSTEILFCYKKRRKADKRFFGMLGKAFTWTEVTDDPNKEIYNREAITLLRLFRPAASGTVNTSERLAGLRQLMAQEEHNIQAFVVPSEDQHSSEYLAHCDERRAFISGFSGSAGCAVVTPKDAFLFTDGRYFLQAEKQLDKNWTLMKQGLPDVPTWQEFLSKNLDPSTQIGIDATLISASNADSINEALESKGSTLVPIEKNLVDAVWSDRPPRPQNPVIHLDEKHSGQSPSHKIRALREELSKKKHQAFVVNMLDEVAWLFNLRGSDIDYNPVFFAYAVVTLDSVNLFVEKAQLSQDSLKYLGDDINIRPYDTFFDYLKQLPSVLTLDEEKKVLIGNTASLAVAHALGKVSVVDARRADVLMQTHQDKFDIGPSPIADLKAIKNATELEGFRQSHIRDGAALARYFAWLEEELNKGTEINESQGADKLEAFRSGLRDYQEGPGMACRFRVNLSNSSV